MITPIIALAWHPPVVCATPGSSLTLYVRRTHLDSSSANTKSIFDLWSPAPWLNSLFAAVGRSFCACPRPHPSGSREIVPDLPAVLHSYYPPGSYHIRPPHSSPFGNTRLVFVNFLPFSNRRFPYLGLVGIFATQIIHFAFLFQFVRQVTSAGIPTHAIPPCRRACVMTSLQHYFFAHILPHRVSR